MKAVPVISPYAMTMLAAIVAGTGAMDTQALWEIAPALSIVEIVDALQELLDARFIVRGVGGDRYFYCQTARGHVYWAAFFQQGSARSVA